MPPSQWCLKALTCAVWAPAHEADKITRMHEGAACVSPCAGAPPFRPCTRGQPAGMHAGIRAWLGCLRDKCSHSCIGPIKSASVRACPAIEGSAQCPRQGSNGNSGKAGALDWGGSLQGRDVAWLGHGMTNGVDARLTGDAKLHDSHEKKHAANQCVR